MGEIKQTNFRIDADTADAFRAFCEEHNYNQAKGFDYLMEVLQITKAKEYVPERLVEIEEFEMHSKAILAAFLKSVETAKNTQLLVRADFESDLAKKEKRITELEGEAEQHKQEVKEAEARAKEAVALQKQAENEAEQAKKLQSAAEKTAADKVAMYEMSQSQLKEATDKLAEYPALKERVELLDKDLADSLRIIQENKKDAERDKERAIADTIKMKDQELAKMQDLKNRRITELEVEVSKVQGTNSELQKQLDKLESKNDGLQDKIAELKAQLAEMKAQNSFLEKQLETKKNNG